MNDVSLLQIPIIDHQLLIGAVFSSTRGKVLVRVACTQENMLATQASIQRSILYKVDRIVNFRVRDCI